MLMEDTLPATLSTSLSFNLHHILMKDFSSSGYTQNVSEISATLFNYFNGVFYGDVSKIESAFHPQCLIFGDVNGQPYFKTLSDYLEVVRNRKSPKDSGEEFRMKVLSVEIVNDIAYARLYVPMFGYHYYDYMALNRINGKWVIVNKIFTNNTTAN